MLRRIFAAAVTLLLAVALLVIAWPQLFGLQQSALIAQAVSLRALAAIGAICGVVVIGFLVVAWPRPRRFFAGIALVLIGFVAINGVVLTSRGLGNGAFEKPTDSSITVLSWNTLGDAPGAAAIADVAFTSEADVIVLPETTEEITSQVAAILASGGRPMQQWTTAFDLISKSRSTSLLISKKLGEYVFDESAGNSSVLPTLVMKPKDGTGPTILAVHLVAPTPGELPRWKKDLTWISGQCDDDNVIMAGDFNATIDHFAGYAHEAGATIGNCTDAAVLTDNAAVGTWPANLPALLGTPIDHVLATPNWRVTGMRVIQDHDTYGSDHRPILVQLTPAG
jgi:endonuclease/exonuclease/phosphatase (EEP) superfamily protein YafD